MGRPAIPLEIKNLSGTARANRISKAMPEKSKNEAFPLPSLTERGLYYFYMLKAQLSALHMDSETYSLVINQAADRLDEIDQCSERLQKEGLTIVQYNAKTGVETEKIHPCVQEKHAASQHLTKLLSELGLTPASIQKVSTKPRAMQEGKAQNSVSSATNEAAANKVESSWNKLLQQ